MIRAFVRKTGKNFTVDFLKKTGIDCWIQHGKVSFFESEAGARLFAERKSYEVIICF